MQGLNPVDDGWRRWQPKPPWTRRHRCSAAPARPWTVHWRASPAVTTVPRNSLATIGRAAQLRRCG